MKRLLALMGFFPLVWYKNSASVYLLRAKQDAWGEWFAEASMGIISVRLLPDGRAPRRGDDPDDVRIWCEWKHNRKHVTFKEQA